MNGVQQDRRGWLIRGVGRTAAMACAALLPRLASALDAPTGKVILTVTGALKERNDGEAASFDITLLDRLPRHSFSTKTPWYPQARKFSGVRVADLLKALGAQASSVKAVALNDYRVEMPLDELVRHGALIASQLDDKPIPVRDKGPLLIIFPFDDAPELRTAVHYSRAIWQLRTLELR
jgi:hypothetical protein